MRGSYKLLSVLALMFCILGYGMASPQEGLMAHWTFDEGKGDTTADISGNGNNATFQGNPEWVNGKFGKALKFDGNSILKVEDSDSVRVTDAFTIALWANPESGQSSWAKFICKQKVPYYPYAIQYDDSQGIFGTGNVNGQRYDTSPHLPNFPGEWHHLALVFNGESLILYKDGEEVARNDSAKGKITQNNEPVTIGGRADLSHPFKGILDDIRLYNRALSQKEIKAVMEGEGGMDASPNGSLSLTWGKLKTLLP